MLVYVDHNLGTVVKDAFVVPEPLEDLAIKMGTLIEDAGPVADADRPGHGAGGDRGGDRLRLAAVPAADLGQLADVPAAGRVDAADAARRRGGSRSGGSGRRRRRPRSRTTFFASPYGAPLDREDERDLLGSVLWFGTSYATGDPCRWSPVTVEMLLADWFPRKVIAEPAYLAKLPDLVRAYIRYCHDRNGIRGDLTEETLAAVDQYEPEYLQLIHSDRQQAMAGLAEALLESERLEQPERQRVDAGVHRRRGRWEWTP